MLLPRHGRAKNPKDEQHQLERQWTLRIERKRYDCERAQRQYDQVEPENRLVARSLERAWEAQLAELENVEREYSTWQEQQLKTVHVINAANLRTLSASLPTLWHAPTTTHQDKKEIIRLLISHVIVEQDRELGKTSFQLNWKTGAISQHTYIRPVSTYEKLADKERLRQRMQQLAAEHYSAREMTQILNAEGFQTARLRPFTSAIVNNLRRKWGIRSHIKAFHPPHQWPDGSYSVLGAAQRLGITPASVRKRIESGRLVATQSRKGAPLHITLNEHHLSACSDLTKNVG